MGYQQITLEGFVGNEPEYKFMPDGTPVCNFSVAVNFPTRDPQRQDTVWHNCAAWGRLAEVVHQYVGKGSHVLVVGKVKPRGYMSQQGEAIGTLNVTCSVVRLLDRKGEGGGQRDYDDDFPMPDDIGDIPF